MCGRPVGSVAAGSVAAAGSDGVAVEVPGGGGQIRIVPREQLELNLSADSQALAFDTTELSLTSLSEDSEPVTVVFPVKNVSSRTLYLTRVSSSCSCLQPEPFDGFLKLSPGESYEIRAVYNPEGHPGKFSRKLFVYTAASEDTPAAVLTVNADVAWSSNPQTEFPVRCGNLLLARAEVTLSGGEVMLSGGEKWPAGKTEIVSIRCYNASSKAMRLSAQTDFVPFPVVMHCEPQVLRSGERGRIVLEIGGAGVAGEAGGCGVAGGAGGCGVAGGVASGEYPIFLKGCGARPSESKIILKIK